MSTDETGRPQPSTAEQPEGSPGDGGLYQQALTTLLLDGGALSRALAHPSVEEALNQFGYLHQSAADVACAAAHGADLDLVERLLTSGLLDARSSAVARAVCSTARGALLPTGTDLTHDNIAAARDSVHRLLEHLDLLETLI